jgi:hypothetical protein
MWERTPQGVASSSLAFFSLRRSRQREFYSLTYFQVIRKGTLCSFAAHCDCWILIQVWTGWHIMLCRWNGSFIVFGRKSWRIFQTDVCSDSDTLGASASSSLSKLRYSCNKEQGSTTSVHCEPPSQCSLVAPY